jgi:hypothetical protein
VLLRSNHWRLKLPQLLDEVSHDLLLVVISGGRWLDVELGDLHSLGKIEWVLEEIVHQRLEQEALLLLEKLLDGVVDGWVMLVILIALLVKDLWGSI